MSRPPSGIEPSAADPLHGQVSAAYAAGKPVAAIADWFGIPVERVQQLLAIQGSVPPVPPRRKRRLWPLAIAASLVLLIGAVVAAVLVLGRGDPSQPGPMSAWEREQLGEGELQSVKDECAAAESGVRVADEGKTLLFDGAGEEDPGGASVASLACLLDGLGTPEAVIAHMDSTSALNGRQEDAWDGFTASWTYHPDNGLDLIIRAG